MLLLLDRHYLKGMVWGGLGMVNDTILTCNQGYYRVFMAI
jgi:hypothetical protein